MLARTVPQRLGEGCDSGDSGSSGDSAFEYWQKCGFESRARHPTDDFHRILGFECRTDYPVGRWTVDLVAIPDDDPERAAAIETRVHPGGPGPHIDRHLQLRRAGWRILEAWPTAHDDDPVRAAFAVAHDLGPDRR